MIWLDTETRSVADVTRCGVYVMAEDPTLRFISIHYAFDDGPVQHWRGLFADGKTPERLGPLPLELFEHIRAGEPVGIWNAAFERHVWNAIAGCTVMPMLQLSQLRCIATNARAHNLPAKLASASMWLPENMRKLSSRAFRRLWRIEDDKPLTAADAEDYELMLRYGDMDVVSMREIARLMLPMSRELLHDYAVSEAINDRGIGVDLAWCRRAVQLKELVDAGTAVQLNLLTDGRISSARQPVALRAWTIEQLDANGIATEPEQFQRAKRKVKPDGTGYFSEITRSFNKPIRRKLREWLDEHGHSIPAVDMLLDLVDEGVGAASSKYQAALDRTSSDGVLRGMYILDGAAQTGRFASTGMQTHNMIRAVLPDPGQVINLLMSTPDEMVAEVCRTEWHLPVNDTLGRLLRPTLVPRQAGRVLLWGDWSAVEARVCPWLSGLPEAEPLLNQFRIGEDVYLAAASAISGQPVIDRKDPMRQLGKVAVLALGFGGGVGAYVSMARNYGLVGPMPVDVVKDIVTRWRAANPWARTWWDQLEAAARQALRRPNIEHRAGRVSFSFLPGLLEGCLVMWLPDGRPLFYPAAEVRMGQRFEDEPPVEVLTFVHAAYGRIPLWYGQLAENATQATAASLLRLAMSRLEGKRETSWRAEVVGHTHDEIIVEAAEVQVKHAAKVLQATMTQVPDWAEGLPLAAEISAGYAYYEPAPELLG